MRPSVFACAALFLAPLVVVASCSVGDLDLTGKQCPCAGGYVCDVPSNTCVLGLTVDGGAPGVGDGGGPSDALLEPERNPAALLGVTKLTPVVDWKTPKIVRWELTVDGKATDFKSYVVELGAAEADFPAKNLTALTSLQRPELGAFNARGPEVQGPVTIWFLSDATANKPQFGRVTVTGINDESNVSAIASATPPAGATKRSKIFDGTTAALTPRPLGEFDFQAIQGAHVFKTICVAPATVCAKRAALVELGLVLNDQGGFSDADFDRAFLDVDISGNVGVTTFDSTVVLEIGNDGCGEQCDYGFRGWTQSSAPGASVATLQVPLKKLVRADGVALTRALLEGKQFKVAGLGFTGTWRQNSSFRLHSASIRW